MKMSSQANLSPATDIISAGAIIGSFVHALPEWAAAIAIVWYCLEIFESRTVQRRIRRRRIRKLQKLRRQVCRKENPRQSPDGDDQSS